MCRLPPGPAEHAREASLHLRLQASQMDLAGGPATSNGCPQPDTVKRGSARIKDVHGITFPVRDRARRRYPADPVPGPLPRPNRRRIVDADRPVTFDDPPSSFGDLPFQRIACQGFRLSSLPYEAPEILLAFGALAGLDPCGHDLQLTPRLRRMVIAVFAKQVGSILQTSYVHLIRDRRQLRAD